MRAASLLIQIKMAKKKRTKARKTTRRRRRIGGLGAMTPSNPLVKYGSMAVGYLLGDKVNEALDKVAGDKMDGKLLAGLQVFAGLVANQTVPLIKAKPNMILTVAGGVLAGAGVKRGLTEFGVINGFFNVPALNGFRSVPALNGYNPTPGKQLNGYNPTPSKVMGGIPLAAVEAGSGVNASDR